jgi:hypothetical protein
MLCESARQLLCGAVCCVEQINYKRPLMTGMVPVVYSVWARLRQVESVCARGFVGRVWEIVLENESFSVHGRGSARRVWRKVLENCKNSRFRDTAR